MADPAGIRRIRQFEAAGASTDQIDEWKAKRVEQFQSAGASNAQINSYFGIKELNTEPFKNEFLKNLEKNMGPKKVPSTPDSPVKAETLDNEQPKVPAPPIGDKEAAQEPKMAESFFDFIEAGFDQSVSGLFLQGKPDVFAPENSPMFYRLLSGVSTLAGDFPAMVAGSFLGTTGTLAAAPLAGPGAPAVAAASPFVGAGTAFALPAAIRSTYMEALEKGEVTSWGEFFESVMAVTLETSKAFATGAITFGVGGKVAKVLGPVAKAPVVTSAAVASEAATLTVVGNALEGEIPEPEEFLDAAIIIGGLRGATKVATMGAKGAQKVSSKLRNIYRETQVKPTEIAEQARLDPHTLQDIGAENITLPKAYEKLRDSKLPNFIEETPISKIDPKLLESSNVVASKPGEIIKSQKIPPLPKEPPKKFKGKTPEEVKVLERMRPADESQPLRVDKDKIYTAVIDDIHPIKQYTAALKGEAQLKFNEDPYIVARVTRGNHGRAEQTLKHSPYDFKTGENVGKALFKILEPVKKDIDGFRAYLGAKRHLEKSAQGIETGLKITRDEALKITTKGQKTLEKPFREFVDYHNNLLKFGRDAGLISEKSFQEITKANVDYVPWNRYFEERTNRPGPTGLGRDFVVKKVVHKMKGSELPVIDPIENTIRKTQFMISMAEKNRAVTTMIELAEKQGQIGEGKLFQKAKKPLQKVTVKAEEIANHLNKQLGQKINLDGLFKDMDIFRAAKHTLRSNEVMLFREGKAEVYKMPEELATAFKATGSRVGPQNWFLKAMALPAKLRRAGVTTTPDFMMRNMVRDQSSAFTLAKHKFIPIVDFLNGMKSIINKDMDLQNFLKSGAANSALSSFDKTYLRSDVYSLSKQTGLLESAWNVVKNPTEMGRVKIELENAKVELLRLAKKTEKFGESIFEPVQTATTMAENATRIGATKRVPKDGRTNIERLFEVGIEGREVTLDFARMGAKTQAVNQITAFWNAHVQGLDRIARAFKDNPEATTRKMVYSITMPSVALWMANHDNPKWQDIPRWQKDNFWIVFAGDKTFRIPKPFEPGLIFGSLFERGLEFMKGDNPKAFKDLSETILRGFIPEYLPTIAEPIIEQFANKSLFTDHKIIPQSLEGVMPKYQFKDYTTETAKIMGRLVSNITGDFSEISSPIVLQNYIRSWGGTVGLYALNLSDELLIKAGVIPDPVRPQDNLEDLPFVRSFFIRTKGGGNQQIADFYDNLNKTRQVRSTLRLLQREGDFEEFQRISLEYKGFLLDMEGANTVMRNTSHMVRNIFKNPDIDPLNKREQIDQIMETRIEAARQANKMFEQFQKEILKGDN